MSIKIITFAVLAAFLVCSSTAERTLKDKREHSLLRRRHASDATPFSKRANAPECQTFEQTCDGIENCIAGNFTGLCDGIPYPHASCESGPVKISFSPVGDSSRNISYPTQVCVQSLSYRNTHYNYTFTKPSQANGILAMSQYTFFKDQPDTFDSQSIDAGCSTFRLSFYNWYYSTYYWASFGDFLALSYFLDDSGITLYRAEDCDPSQGTLFRSLGTQYNENVSIAVGNSVLFTMEQSELDAIYYKSSDCTGLAQEDVFVYDGDDDDIVRSSVFLQDRYYYVDRSFSVRYSANSLFTGDYTNYPESESLYITRTVTIEDLPQLDSIAVDPSYNSEFSRCQARYLNMFDDDNCGVVTTNGKPFYQPVWSPNDDFPLGIVFPENYCVNQPSSVLAYRAVSWSDDAGKGQGSRILYRVDYVQGQYSGNSKDWETYSLRKCESSRFLFGGQEIQSVILNKDKVYLYASGDCSDLVTTHNYEQMYYEEIATDFGNSILYQDGLSLYRNQNCVGAETLVKTKIYARRLCKNFTTDSFSSVPAYLRIGSRQFSTSYFDYENYVTSEITYVEYIKK